MTGFTDGRLPVEGVLVEEQLLAESVAQVPALLESLHFPFLRDVAERDLTIHHNVESADRLVLLEQLLTPTDLDKLRGVKNQLEGVLGHQSEPGVIEPNLLQKQMLPARIAVVHDFLVLAYDLSHHFVVQLVERVIYLL